jgi:hypothetical protein
MTILIQTGQEPIHRLVVATHRINGDLRQGFSAILAGENPAGEATHLIQVITPARNVGRFRNTLYAANPERLKRQYE